jgi:hypothetical protein
MVVLMQVVLGAIGFAIASLAGLAAMSSYDAAAQGDQRA